VVKFSEDLKNVGIRRFLFSDFDRDGVKNVDDYKPFDRSVKKYPDGKKHPNYYHRARFGNDENNVLLSSELLSLERLNNKRADFLNGFLASNKGSFGRIKSVPSTMKKLRERFYNPKVFSGEVGVFDVAGATILSNTRRGAFVKAKNIRGRYRVDEAQSDNYYANPKDNVYYAVHLGLVDSRNPNIRLEVQSKSKRMYDFQKGVHSAYKRGERLDRFVKPSKRLFDLGF